MLTPDLLTVLGRSTPTLTGALCKGSTEWDPGDGLVDTADADAVRARHREAIRQCRRCPALDPCSEWLAGLPRWERPGGVVAGRVVTSGLQRRPYMPADGGQDGLPDRGAPGCITRALSVPGHPV